MIQFLKLKNGLLHLKYKRTQIDIDLHEQNKRVCLCCFEIKNISEFNKSPKGWKGKNSYCRLCFDKNYRANDKKSLAAYMKDRRRSGDYRKNHRIRQQARRVLINSSSELGIDAYCKWLLSIDLCFYCSLVIEAHKRTIEHIVAISKGGTHTKSNLVMACTNCNFSKYNKDVSIFIEKFSIRKQIEILEKINGI